MAQPSGDAGARLAFGAIGITDVVGARSICMGFHPDSCGTLESLTSFFFPAFQDALPPSDEDSDADKILGLPRFLFYFAVGVVVLAALGCVWCIRSKIRMERGAYRL